MRHPNTSSRFGGDDRRNRRVYRSCSPRGVVVGARFLSSSSSTSTSSFVTVEPLPNDDDESNYTIITTDHNNSSGDVSIAAADRRDDNDDDVYDDRVGVHRSTAVELPFSHVQRGFGRIVATASSSSSSSSSSRTAPSTKTTRLSTLSHKAPIRLVPIYPSTKLDRHGTSVVTVSQYGGGMAAGDVANVHVKVQEHAKLILNSQGSNRIYKQRGKFDDDDDENVKEVKTTTTRSQLEVKVEQDALFVAIPDPVSLQEGCLYQQIQSFHVHPLASLVAIDWVSAGRLSSGERWRHKFCRLRSEVQFIGSEYPSVVDAQSVVSDSADDGAGGLFLSDMDWKNLQFHAFATVFLYGQQVEKVLERFQLVQVELCRSFTRVRDPFSFSNGSATFAPEQQQQQEEVVVESSSAQLQDLLQQQLAGRVVVGVSQAPIEEGTTTNHAIYTVRLAAATNEDLYRIFHYCLQPLAVSTGMECYRERLAASRSAPTIHVPRRDLVATLHKSTVVGDAAPPTVSTLHTTPTAASTWLAYMLADSGLPTGSFAHSSGLEAASQLGLIQEDACLRRFVRASTRSALMLSTPFVRHAHRLASSQRVLPDTVEKLCDSWLELDRYAHAVLATNEPACRASLDQGRSLLRLAIQMLENSADLKPNVRILGALQSQVGRSAISGHISAVLGVVTSLLGLAEDEACGLLGYCIARDIVSSAVRLNLIGPMAAQGLLLEAQQSANDGICEASLVPLDGSAYEVASAAAGCAPILEAIHPCHDLLMTRLFRT